MNKNETVVIAAFADEPAAARAADNLREWDKRVREVKLGVIGLVHMPEGVIKADVLHGSLFHRAMPISDDALRVLAQELGDRVALVVACDDYEAEMVVDSLTRDGGEVLANTHDRTDEERAKEAEDVNQALMEQAIHEAATQAKLSPGRNIHRPV